MPKPITVLVAGATGRQGGAVARLLLERGHRVRALTRRPGSQAAAALHVLGAELFEADLDDEASVRAAAEDADAFFLVATPFEEGVLAEARQARRAADAAKKAGVRHLVYSSVASADHATGVPHFESKREVERHVEALGVPYTIVAPAFFMENLLGASVVEGLRAGTLSLPLAPERRLQMVAIADVAGLVRLALERPSELVGRRIDVASDALTGPEIARALSQATGSAIDYSAAPIEALRSRSEDLALMWEWLDRAGSGVDLDALRRRWPEAGWHDFGRWTREQDWSVLDVASPEQPTA
ncbi:MAG TPA: NmrA/HSCARG family protein [Anaeromyxobacteraceae bacterium]|nr:NmrA/HSCARG family protein [Anaeromyxobacteraceae bacterium]